MRAKVVDLASDSHKRHKRICNSHNLLSWIRLTKMFDEKFEKYNYSQRLFLKSNDSNPLTISDSSTFSRYYILYCRGETKCYAFCGNRIRVRVGKYPETEKQLLTYIEEHRDKNQKGLINLTRDEVKEHALCICQSIAARCQPMS